MTVKMFGLIPPKPGMTSEEFHDYYRHPHGTIGQNMTTMRGYVQSHQIHTDLLGPGQKQYEAVAEVWLDNENDILNFRDEPVLVKYLIEDEPKFVDMEKLTFLAASEEVITSGPRINAGLHPGDEMWSLRTRPLSVKLLHFVLPDGNANWAQVGDAALGLKLGAFRHVRCRPLAMFHRDKPTFIGLHELWWPTRTAFHRAVAAEPKAFETLLAQAGKSVTLLAQAERFI